MIIDWIACTIPDGSPAVIEWIKRSLTGPWNTRDYAYNRYTRTLSCGGVSLLTDAPHDEGIHLIATGQGCRELERAGLVEDWPDFIARLLRADGNFTRIDAAIDDRDGALCMDEIFRCYEEGRIVCRYEKIIHSGERNEITGASTGRMLTFGKRGSLTRINIYDKSLEQRVPQHWIRVELQARKVKAQELAQAIAEQGGGVVSEVLLGCLAFKECGTTDRRERWPTAEWWTRFLGTEECFRLQNAPRNGSLEKLYCWLIRQCSRALATLHDSGLYPTLWSDLLEQGRLKRDGRTAKAKPRTQKARTGTDRI